MDDLDYGETLVGLKPGLKVFNRFTLENLIGRGGMAQVWRAQDDTLGASVALKFLRQLVVTDRSALNELIKEVRRSRELTHTHIVRVNDFHQSGQVAGIYCMMPHLLASPTVRRSGCVKKSIPMEAVTHC